MYQELAKTVNDFINIPIDSDDEINFHTVVAHMHLLCAAIGKVYNGSNREEIEEIILPAKEVQGRSKLINRLQTWPKGYKGDFITIDSLLEGVNRSKPGTLEFYCEEYTLKSCPAAQHYNKITEQAFHLLETIIDSDQNKKILILSSGSCADLRRIQNIIKKKDVNFLLTDIDKDAINFAQKKLTIIKDKCVFLDGNIFSVLKGMKDQKFDLIAAQGIFAYLEERAYTFLLEKVYNKLLNEPGKIFITNMGKNSNFKIWMSFFVDWNLIERDETEILSLCKQSGIDEEKISIKKERSNITYTIEINK